jgi:hypothetical protein
MAALLACCSGAATAGVDDVWNASPATQDTQWAQANLATVIPSNSGNKPVMIRQHYTLAYSAAAVGQSLGKWDFCFPRYFNEASDVYMYESGGIWYGSYRVANRASEATCVRYE